MLSQFKKLFFDLCFRTTPGKKIYQHYRIYKSANSEEAFPLLGFVFKVLFYRRILAPILAIPILIIILGISPIIKIRLFRLSAAAMGHFAVNTERLIRKLEDVKKDKYLNLFYIEEHFLYIPHVSNFYLLNKWKEKIWIFPLWMSPILMVLDRWLLHFFANNAYDVYGNKKIFEEKLNRDIENSLKDHPPLLSFSREEHECANKTLAKMEIGPKDRFICLLIRTSAYHQKFPNWNSPDRNATVSNYMKACWFLAERGYFVLRMGKVKDEPFYANHPRVIDYANSEFRSDFMDIYLAAHCYFFITTGTGLECVAEIFRRPIVTTNYHMMTFISTWHPHVLCIPKMTAFRDPCRLMSFTENANYLSTGASGGGLLLTYKNFNDYLKLNQLSLIENTEDEILDVVKEMEARMNGNWMESQEERQRQELFWQYFPTKMRHDINLNIPAHGKIAVKIGAKFLEKYQNLLC